MRVALLIAEDLLEYPLPGLEEILQTIQMQHWPHPGRIDNHRINHIAGIEHYAAFQGSCIEMPSVNRLCKIMAIFPHPGHGHLDLLPGHHMCVIANNRPGGKHIYVFKLFLTPIPLDDLLESRGVLFATTLALEWFRIH